MTLPTPPSRGTKRAPVRIGLIGTGLMAASHARLLRKLPGARLVAAADLDAARAEAFAREHGIPAAYAGPEPLLRAGACDAVIVVTPDAAHKPVTLAALRAGCHVLCEKPLALNHAEACAMVRAARRARKVNLVNFSYRDWPALQAVAEVVGRGDIGEVRHVEASYLQSWIPSKVWGDWRKLPAFLWRMSRRHGSQGVLGDVGVHIIDFASYPAGDIAEVSCRLQTFRKTRTNRQGPYVLDANDSAVLGVTFANGALGAIHTTRWACGHKNRLYLQISGTQGAVEIDSARATDAFRLCRGRDVDRAEWRDVRARRTPNNHERFVTAIRGGPVTGADFARGAAVQQVLDACFESDRLRRPVTL